jgi:deoxyribonuclease-1
VADTVCGIDEDLGSALGAAVAAGTTAGKPNEYSGSCGGSDASEAVLGWTAPAAGDYVFDTMGSSLSTVLYALQGSCAGAEIACNDDTDGTPQSAISLNLDLGETVVLVIDSFAQQTGDYELNITSLECPGADLGSPIGSTVIADTTTGESKLFTGSCGGSDAPERTFAFVAPKPALYTFHTLGSSLPSVIYLLDGACDGAELACNDDFDGTQQSAVSISLTQGQRIIVVVDGEDSLAGDFDLTITYDLYDGLEGLNDGALLQPLYGLVAEHAGLDYTGARLAMFSSIDNEAGEVECVYTGYRLMTEAIPDHTIMNTEHTWAQSWGADIWPARTDLHHLFPTTNQSNSIRASYYFGEVVSADWSNGGSMRGLDDGGQIVFEPRDVHKGDVARALFYFSVRYLMEIPDGQEAVIRAWSSQDPPDEKERQRNDAVEQTQQNRNPFIDHPEYIDRIADF